MAIEHLCFFKFLFKKVYLFDESLLTQVENEKTRKYDLIANELSLTYKCKVKIIPYVMTWEGLVTKYHKKHRSAIGISTKTEANKLLNIVKTFNAFPSTADEVSKRKIVTTKFDE